MTGDAWLTLGVVALLCAALMRNLAPPDLLFLSATVFLSILGVITPEEAFAGFSNTGMLTVGALFVVVAGLRETGVLDAVGYRVLGGARSERGVLARLTGVVLPMSGFLNNTPIVAMFVPVVLDWCRRNDISPSRLLIPLSYLSILGGACTLIGTSTNLVVSGLMQEEGFEALGLFEIGKLGIPFAVLGVAYLFAVGRWLLPDRTELLEQLGESLREYVTEVLVEPGCRMADQTVETAGLRRFPGLLLVEIQRGDETIGPVGPGDVIRAGDKLVFSGIVSSIVELKKTPGLVPVSDPEFEVTPSKQRDRRLCEAVISANSPLVGKTVRSADFRAVYGAAVVAVHRGGSRITSSIADLRLRAGDTLLLQVPAHFLRAYRHDPAFYLVSDVADWRPVRRDRSRVALAIFGALVVTMATGLLPIVLAATFAAALIVATGCLSPSGARQSVEWQVLLTIAAAFGVGSALENSGAARTIASAVVGSTEAWGPVAALALIYLMGSILTELITNNAAAVLMFPFCLEMARLFEVDPMPFLMALVLSASASFMTPIGYQTNMMVYGPGGYRFTDFLRIGAPLNLLLWLVAVLLIPQIWPF